MEGRHLHWEAQEDVGDAETHLEQAEKSGESGKARKARLAPCEKSAQGKRRQKEVAVRAVQQMETLCTLEGWKEDASHTGGPLKARKTRIARRNEAAKHDLKRQQCPRRGKSRAKAPAERGRIAPLSPRSCCSTRKPLLDHKKRCREEIPNHEVRGHRPCREQLAYGFTAKHDLKGEKESSSADPSRCEPPRLRGGEGCGR